MRVDILVPKSGHRVSQVLGGIFGAYRAGGKFEVDPAIRDLAPIFSLIGTPQFPIPITKDEIVPVEVPDAVADAFKLNLISRVSSSWPSLYESVAGGAAASNPLVAAVLESERSQMAANVASLHHANNLQAYVVPVSISGSFNNRSIDEFGDDSRMDDEGVSTADECLELIANEGEVFTESLRATGPAELAAPARSEVDSGDFADELIDVEAATDAGDGQGDAPVEDDLQPIVIRPPEVFDPREAFRRRQAGLMPRITQMPEVNPLPAYASFSGDLLFTAEGKITVMARNAEEAQALVPVLAAFPHNELRQKMLGEVFSMKVVDVSLYEVEEHRPESDTPRG